MERRTDPHERLVQLILEAQRTGKVVDVSNLGPQGGGGRLINKNTAKKNGMKEYGNLPIVSSNLTGYFETIKLVSFQPEFNNQDFTPLVEQFVEDKNKYLPIPLQLPGGNNPFLIPQTYTPLPRP